MITVNLKKSLLLIVFAFSIFDLCGQHITFLGIPLGQSENSFCQKLNQKGFNYIGINVFFDTKMYEGKFWNYPKCRLNITTENGKVTCVLANPDDNKQYYKSDFNKLVASLDKKYGKHHPKENLFNDFSFWPGIGYYWKVTGGYIVSSFISPKNNTKGNNIISIFYLDNTDSRVIYELGKKRNTDNDL